MPPKRKSPYEVTSSAMAREDFVLSHPFVKVRAGAVAKFDFNLAFEAGVGGRIARVNGVDKELLDYFMVDHLYPTMQKASSCYQLRTTENKFRALASCFFPIFTHLAPDASDAELLKQHEQVATSDDAVEGLCAVNAPSSSTSSNTMLDGGSRDELSFVQEDGADLRPRQAVDFRGYAFGMQQRFTLLIVDAKQKNFIWDAEREKDSVLYQLGDYACCAAVANIDQGRFKPIHILTLADGDYAIACLDVEGYLTVDEDGRITDESYEEFLDHRVQKWQQLNPGVACNSLSDTELAELRAKFQNDLDKSRKDMKKKRLDDGIPVGSPLLVGEIAYHPLARTWTKFPLNFQAWFSADDYVFIAGLLRILYGDRVLSWTRSTLEALAQAHDAKLNTLGRNLALVP